VNFFIVKIIWPFSTNEGPILSGTLTVILNLVKKKRPALSFWRNIISYWVIRRYAGI
jgi:hypothetical protein